MNPVKEVIVSDLLDRLKSSPYLLVVDYQRTTVPEFSEARKRLRNVGARMTVARNSFVRIAASKAGITDDLAKTLLGQNAIVTGGEDIAAAAKVLRQFSTESKKLEVKGGVVDGNFIDQAGAQRLADLPSKSQLQAQLLGVLLAPATKLVRTLNEPAAALARVLQAHADASKAA
jgi:large subunit ribosomal protein L10